VLLARAAQRDALAALEALSARLLGLAAQGMPGASLAGGQAGIALAHAALEGALPRRGHGAAAEGALDLATGALEKTPFGPSLYGGFPGIAWVAELLTGDPRAAPANDPLRSIDAALDLYLRRPTARPVTRWNGPYDLIDGLVGVGVYALERLPRASGKRLLARVVARLAESSQPLRPGVAWWSDPEWVPKKWRRTPHAAYNLGVAHGTPGVIALLGRVMVAEIDAPTRRMARKLLHGGVEWLLAQELPPGSHGSFATAADPGLRREPARLAWCYGDPGIAAALLVAARGAKMPAWEEAALRVALRAAARPVETSGVRDAGLCHGAAGVAHIFHRLSVATRERRLADAARSWFARTLAMRRARGGFAGFRAWVPDARGKPSWQADPGFLTGAAGVTLALVAATTDAEPAWDRALLIS
jgi:hypothetical protein